MTVKPRIDQRHTYEYEYNTLTYWGVNPVHEKFPFLNYFRLFLVLSIALTLYVTMMIQTCMETSFAVIIGNLYFSTSQLTYILKLFNYLYKREKIFKIHQLLTLKIFNSYEEDQHRFIIEKVINTNKLSTIFRYLIVVWLAMYLIYPVVDNSLLAIPAWYPFNVEKYRWYIIIYQVASVAISALINSSMDIVTIGFISVATAHFSIIKDTLTNIKKGENLEDVKRKIAFCCHYHNSTIDLTVQVEDVFSYGILMQFLASMIALCITGFEMLLVSQYSAQFVMLMSYLFLIMTQLTLYCLFGHNVMVKSEEVRDACYMSEWNEYDSSVRKMLFIIMERAKRPIKLTAGKFFFLNIPTFVGILRSAYSYFAILRQVYTKNNL